MTVIVEPDDLSAWVGPADVIATSGVTWLQGKARDRKAERRELIDAVTEVRARSR